MLRAALVQCNPFRVMNKVSAAWLACGSDRHVALITLHKLGQADLSRGGSLGNGPCSQGCVLQQTKPSQNKPSWNPLVKIGAASSCLQAPSQPLMARQPAASEQAPFLLLGLLLRRLRRRLHLRLAGLDLAPDLAGCPAHLAAHLHDAK